MKPSAVFTGGIQTVECSLLARHRQIDLNGDGNGPLFA